jgi:hypothetical protein
MPPVVRDVSILTGLSHRKASSTVAGREMFVVITSKVD